MCLEIHVSLTRDEAGRNAAEKASQILRNILTRKSKVRFVAATGASQFEFLDYLSKSEGIDWDRTEMFHLDEYIGIPSTHPSFRKYLKERLVDKVHPGTVHFIQGDASDPYVEVKRISNLILKDVIDVAFIGIGENGHIAFNDPPADFETEDPYIIVDLNEKCRQQQVNEGWFTSIDKVPQTAISMSVKQIIKSNMIICTCPDKRKAMAVKNCLSSNSAVTPLHPASILKLHPQTYVFLDRGSASLLS
jgi:glucosamine-6-phosphate deaminase